MSKSFKDRAEAKRAENPALMFISQAETPETPETARQPEKIPERRGDPPRRESKSRRLQLLIQPSLYEAIRERAEAEGVSVNEEISELLRSALGK